MIMNGDYQIFSASIFLLVIGILLMYRAILKNESFTSKSSSGGITSISIAVNKFFRPVTELAGITTTEILLELLMRVGLLFSTILLLSQVLSLNLLQVIFITLFSSVVIALWTQGFRTRFIKKYVTAFELEFSDFVESLALAVNSGLPLISGLTRVIAEYLKDEPPIASKFGASKIEQSRGLASKLALGRLRTPIQRESLSPRQLRFRAPVRRETRSPLLRELVFLRNNLEDGLSVSSSFTSMSLRLHSSLVSNFSDAIGLSLIRGTPLANMLSDHADAMRESQKRILLERAGRAEVKMMVPVVFLLLPISVLFALWPSFQQLQQMVVIP
jgi:Flp pilus assembly protein TadB